MKRITAIVMMLALSVALLAGCNNVDESELSRNESRVENIIVDVTLDKSLVYYANIEIENYGTVIVELDQEEAPITVANFVSHAQSGFYDGLTFHRIIEGFMMQGGDPDADGTGGSKKNVVGEFTANGYDNNISHDRGVISMARSNNPDSASSQFFIVHKDSPHLDGQYAAFGRVIEGLEIVDKVCEDAEPLDGNGTIAFSKQPVITKISITTEQVETTADSETDSESIDSEETSDIELSIDTSLKYFADIEIKDYGTVTVELNHEEAPITVDNFVTLAQDGFYDGLTFHRIIEGFMMQGGDPEGNGTGGSDKEIVGEFSANGHNNGISHVRGVISMARALSYDSASSQFFIVHEDSTFLDGQYAAFGVVTSGIEIVDSICESADPTDGNGTISADEQPVITKITIRTE